MPGSAARASSHLGKVTRQATALSGSGPLLLLQLLLLATLALREAGLPNTWPNPETAKPGRRAHRRYIFILMPLRPEPR